MHVAVRSVVCAACTSEEQTEVQVCRKKFARFSIGGNGDVTAYGIGPWGLVIPALLHTFQMMNQTSLISVNERERMIMCQKQEFILRVRPGAYFSFYYPCQCDESKVNHS